MTEPPSKRGKTVASVLQLSKLHQLHQQHQHQRQQQLQLQDQPSQELPAEQQKLEPRAVTPAYDRLSQLPEDILFRITSHLDAPSLLQLSAVNKFYYQCARHNQAGWEALCRDLWKDKIFVCASARALLDPASSSSSHHDKKEKEMGAATSPFSGGKNHSSATSAALHAYRLSWQDAKERHYIRLEEFCYDHITHTGTIWHFRFKESAGSDWTALDPWYQGHPCRQVVFLKDGRVQQYIRDPNTGVIRLPHLAVPTTWRFLTRPMDLPRRALGSYVRLTVAGRDVPAYALRRSPTGNWGFIMESCWGLYASFPLPLRKRRVLRRTADHVAWIPADVIDQDDEDRNQRPLPQQQLEQQHPQQQLVEQQHPRLLARPIQRSMYSSSSAANSAVLQSSRPGALLPPDIFQDDSALLITNEIQWREAFLYNVGARVLPEGDHAMDDFDRAWGGN